MRVPDELALQLAQQLLAELPAELLAEPSVAQMFEQPAASNPSIDLSAEPSLADHLPCQEPAEPPSWEMAVQLQVAAQGVQQDLHAGVHPRDTQQHQHLLAGWAELSGCHPIFQAYFAKDHLSRPRILADSCLSDHLSVCHPTILADLCTRHCSMHSQR